MIRYRFGSLWIFLLVFVLLGRVEGANHKYDSSEITFFRVMLPESESGKNGKAGYILLSTGEWIIPPQFDEAYNFRGSNRALVTIIQEGNKRQGYIDLQGNIVIKPQYINAHSFSEGIASVDFFDGYNPQRHLYIDESGNVVLDSSSNKNVQEDFTIYRDFHEGLAEMQIGASQGGFIDRTGKIAIQPRFVEVRPFIDGIALVSETKDNDLRYAYWGFINKIGEYIISPQYANLKQFSGGLAAAQLERRGLWGFIDKTGNTVIEAQFTNVGSFVDNMAPAKINGKWGFIDQHGIFVIAPQFDDAREFEQGLARVAINGRYGWINKDGNWAISPLFTGNAMYLSKQKIIYDKYFYDTAGKQLNHYANHMTAAYDYMKKQDYKAAITAFELALKINSEDKAASWGLALAKDSQKIVENK